ncbi:MAG: hypothetical protein EBT12_11525, partial [Marivivens sp.]|nr:hypothetical protein [Marivivens sp.]
MGFIGDLFGGGDSQPVQTVQAQNTPQFAAEQKPYVEKIFGEAQNLYEQRRREGFQPFPGPQLAPLSAEEKEALSGIARMARGPGPAQDFAKGREALMMSAAPIGQQDIQRLMSPYAQNVIDIEKREAAREFQKQLPQIAGSAVAQGGLRGSRRAILEAEAGRNLQRQLGDIQTRGLQSAYDRALAEAAKERGRLAVLSEALPRLGQTEYMQGLQQLTQLGGVGETQRAQRQAAIDLARQQFELEKAFPEQALARFTGFVRGVPSPTGSISTSTTSQPAPSGLGQLAALSLAGAQILGSSGTNSILGSLFGASGGRVGGLSSVVRRNRGGQVVRMQNGGSPLIEALTPRPSKRGADVRAYMRGITTGEVEPPKSALLEYIFGTREGYEQAKQSIRDARQQRAELGLT